MDTKVYDGRQTEVSRWKGCHTASTSKSCGGKRCAPGQRAGYRSVKPRCGCRRSRKLKFIFKATQLLRESGNRIIAFSHAIAAGRPFLGFHMGLAGYAVIGIRSRLHSGHRDILPAALADPIGAFLYPAQRILYFPAVQSLPFANTQSK